MTKIDFKIKKVKEVLDVLAQHEQIIFRGGTALSLAYGEIQRSSEDIDFSVLKGEQAIQEVIEYIQAEVSKFSWAISVEIGKMLREDDAIIIEFNNEAKESPFDNGGFTFTKIYLELPRVAWDEGEIPYVIIAPYKGSEKTMKVMSIEAILKDKGMAITEKFLVNMNMDWAVSARADSRHIYDFYVLYDKHISKVSDASIVKTIKKTILLKQEKGYRNKYQDSLSHPLDADLIWAVFLESYKKQDKDIKDKIENIVYPNAEKFNKKEFLKRYKVFFYRVIDLINSNIIL